LTGHVAHGHVHDARRLTERVQRHDTGVLELRGQARLGAEPLARIFAGLEVVAKHLERDVPVQTDITGEIHGAPSSATERAHDLVLPYEPAGHEIPFDVRCSTLERRRHPGYAGSGVEN